MRLGINQVRLLVTLASPTTALVVADDLSRSLCKRGLCKEGMEGGMVAITPAGLRALADEMEAGRVADAIERMRQDHDKRRKRHEANAV